MNSSLTLWGTVILVKQSFHIYEKHQPITKPIDKEVLCGKDKKGISDCSIAADSTASFKRLQANKA